MSRLLSTASGVSRSHGNQGVLVGRMRFRPPSSSANYRNAATLPLMPSYHPNVCIGPVDNLVRVQHSRQGSMKVHEQPRLLIKWGKAGGAHRKLALCALSQWTEYILGADASVGFGVETTVFIATSSLGVVALSLSS
eukprot:scaffold136263_cov40-Tisochrysis_lutea.AAC.3